MRIKSILFMLFCIVFGCKAQETQSNQRHFYWNTYDYEESVSIYSKYRKYNPAWKRYLEKFEENEKKGTYHPLGHVHVKLFNPHGFFNMFAVDSMENKGQFRFYYCPRSHSVYAVNDSTTDVSGMTEGELMRQGRAYVLSEDFSLIDLYMFDDVWSDGPGTKEAMAIVNQRPDWKIFLEDSIFMGFKDDYEYCYDQIRWSIPQALTDNWKTKDKKLIEARYLNYPPDSFNVILVRGAFYIDYIHPPMDMPMHEGLPYFPDLNAYYRILVPVWKKKEGVENYWWTKEREQ